MARVVSVLAIQATPYVIVDLAIFLAIMKHAALRNHWPLPLIAATCFGEALDGVGYITAACYHLYLIYSGNICFFDLFWLFYFS